LRHVLPPAKFVVLLVLLSACGAVQGNHTDEVLRKFVSH
jgi:hypothetical protein